MSSNNGLENGTAESRPPVTDPDETPLNPHFTESSETPEVLKGAEIRIPMPWGHVAGKQWGNPEGIPVLGLHGWMDNAGTFDRLAPLLSSSLYFVAVELPGHGLSSHLPAGVAYHFIDYMLVVRRIAKHLKWTKFNIVGHSMGAGVGSLYASIYPADIANLVLLDLAKLITSSQSSIVAKLPGALNAYLSLEDKMDPVPPSYTYFDALERLMKATYGGLTEESAKCLMIRGTRQVDEDKWSFTRDIRIRSPTIMHMTHEISYEILNQIRCRVLLLTATIGVGFEAAEVTTKAIDIYRQKCSDFQMFDVEGNHFFHLNNPEETAQHVNKFLEGQRSNL